MAVMVMILPLLHPLRFNVRSPRGGRDGNAFAALMALCARAQRTHLRADGVAFQTLADAIPWASSTLVAVGLRHQGCMQSTLDWCALCMAAGSSGWRACYHLLPAGNAITGCTSAARDRLAIYHVARAGPKFVVAGRSLLRYPYTLT